MKAFYANDRVLYIMVGIVLLFIMAQSIFFFIKALKQAKEINMDRKILKKVIISSAVFTILPAISILIGVISLSKFLGIPLPWLRLSVIGSLTYELTAASTAAASVVASISETVTDPSVYSMIAWVMTIGSIFPLILIPLFFKKIQKGVANIKTKDNKWGEIFITSLFLGMISAFLGVVFAKITTGLKGWIPVFVLLTSAIVMAGCGLLIKAFKIKWLENFALPFSMIGSMAFAIFITKIIG
jgi:hypothetical protein